MPASHRPYSGRDSNGKVVISLPPPPTIKENPEAKPERLGRVIKQLAWCYRRDLSGKVEMANKVLQTLTGLRVSESLMRKLNFADYGALRYSGTYNTLVSWPLYAWTDKDIADYVEANHLPLNPLYGMGYQRVGCWACLQDL